MLRKRHVRSLDSLAFRIATLGALRPSRPLSRRGRRGDAGTRGRPAASSQRLRPGRRSRSARRGQGFAGALAEGRAAVAARRRADHDQGHDSRQRLADALRFARHRRDRGGGERSRRRPGRGSGHGPARQVDHAGVRLEGADRFAAAGHHAQPVEPQPLARRLVGRRLLAHRRRRQSLQPRQRRRRLDPHSRGAHRPRRPEAILRPHRAVSRRLAFRRRDLARACWRAACAIRRWP